MLYIRRSKVTNKVYEQMDQIPLAPTYLLAPLPHLEYMIRSDLWVGISTMLVSARSGELLHFSPTESWF